MIRAPRFSRGIRQRLKAAADAGGWREKHAIRVDNHDEDADRTYTDLLATSVFCFVLPGEHGSPARPAPSAVHASRQASYISMSPQGSGDKACVIGPPGVAIRRTRWCSKPAYDLQARTGSDALDTSAC